MEGHFLKMVLLLCSIVSAVAFQIAPSHSASRASCRPLFSSVVPEESKSEEEASEVIKSFKPELPEAAIQYENAINQALKTNLDPLRKFAVSGATWDNPVEAQKDRAGMEKLLLDVGNFLEDPRLTVHAARARGGDGGGGALVEVDWLKTATWPLPWRPPVQVFGRTVLRLDGEGRLAAAADTWEQSPYQVALGQCRPRFWDFYHFKAFPPAEFPAYRVAARGEGYEVRDYAPRLVVVGRTLDRVNTRETRAARTLPESMFSCTISMIGKIPERFYVTSPIEVSFRGKMLKEGDAQKKVNAIQWKVGLPKAFGLELGGLPDPDGRETAQEMQDDRVWHQVDGPRRVAVARFNGQNQDVGVSKARAELLAKAQEDGHELLLGNSGRPQFSFLQNDAKVGFKRTGGLGVAGYEPRWDTGNEIALELAPPPSSSPSSSSSQ
uniref:Uncharacterized protein n=1 Tax=Heterosigma akashiwo TaxID=2829 RepID=A0A6V1P7S5_HETAK|mmetsp:Transcript_30990/g.50625  ORF Transcript_30990/g.50625 Transcript_30990/m.50625 type:complete len:438 (+) Transcript_30990:50-1363(+)